MSGAERRDTLPPMDRWYTKNARRKIVRTVRLGRWLSKCGVASRSVAARIIELGRVAVNGGTVRDPDLGVAPGHDQVTVDGRRLAPRDRVAILLHKPVDVVTTAWDPEGRRTVYDLLPPQIGWVFPVGRLDRVSTGLLLMTNDTRLGERLTNARHGVPKTYVVKVGGTASDSDIDRLARGIRLDDGYLTQPAEVRRIVPPSRATRPDAGGLTWLEITLHEGKNRQIRRMCKAIGHGVLRLKRVRIGPLTIEGLSSGEHRVLTAEEYEALRASVGLMREG